MFPRGVFRARLREKCSGLPWDARIKISLLPIYDFVRRKRQAVAFDRVRDETRRTVALRLMKRIKHDFKIVACEVGHEPL